LFLSQFLLNDQMANLGIRRMEKMRELARKEQIENAETELALKGYTPHTAEAGDVTSRPDVEVYGKGWMMPKGKFIPVSVEGKNIPGNYFFQYGNSAPQLVKFPREFSKFKTEAIDLGGGERAVVGYPVDEQGIPATEHVKVLSKPENLSPSDVWKGLQIKALMGLSDEDKRKALFPGLKGETEPKALRQLDIYAKSAGVDPSALRDGSLTQEQATKITNKIIEVGDKSILSQLMRGSLGGIPSGGNMASPQGGAGNPMRELELLRKKSTGALTSDEEQELNMIRGGQ
jgi:hypothetical protein